MLCCVCLLENTKMLDIFDKKAKNLNIADIINIHFWFEVLPNDSLTSHICTICWKKIEEFHEFYKHVEIKHKSFHKSQRSSIKEEDLAHIKQEEDLDVSTLEDNVMHIEVGITKYTENTKVIHKNPLENAPSDLQDKEYGNEDISDEYETSENSEPEDKSNEEVSKNQDDMEKVQRNITRKHSNKSKKNINNTKTKRSSNRLDSKLTEQLIKKHVPMLCDLCVFSGKTFSDVVGHFKQHHTNIPPYIMCCNRKFTRSYCIDQHAIIHENPDSFRCNDCNRSFTTIYGLRTHNLNHHAPEEKRIHACEFCPRRFGRRQLLEVHRQTHIPKEEWTITCTKCTTRTVKFVSQYLLNIHTSMFHRREKNICHVCAKEIKDKKAFEKHVRAHFEESGPRVKCKYPNCGRWLKDEDNLKTHMQLHNLAGKSYKCPECNKECPNRRALTNHKRYVHSNPNFRCEECDKCFKKAISLKEHITQHTGETLYNCPFCARTFNSNANMHAHKKKKHPIEWKELRRKNIGPLPE